MEIRKGTFTIYRIAFSSKAKYNLFFYFIHSPELPQRSPICLTLLNVTNIHIYTYKTSICVYRYIHPPNVYKNMPKNSLIITPSRIFTYINIFKMLRNGVLHDNTLGVIGFMDQLIHNDSSICPI